MMPYILCIVTPEARVKSTSVATERVQCIALTRMSRKFLDLP